MNRKLWFVVLVIFVVAAILSLSGCSDDDDGGMTGPPDASEEFNGTFVGTVTVTQGGAAVQSTITLNLTVMSPLSGNFSIDDGTTVTTGEITGDAFGDSADFVATIDPPCEGVFSGTMDLIDGSISIEAEGEDCDSTFDVTGAVDAKEVACNDQIDNDNDDLVDCDDPDCDEDPACVSCGDGTVDAKEECDDGNTESCDGCSAKCQDEVGLVCGDGILNKGCGEECDDGNSTAGDGCSDTCTTETLANCTVTFDGAPNCPDPTPVCGATFSGGGCEFANLPFCYDTGIFSYESTPGNPVTINLDGDLNSLLVFFASAGPAPGVMTFFDAQDVQVGAPLMSNGNCLVVMPERQMVNFSSPVRRITFEPTGSDTVYVDTFEVNP